MKNKTDELALFKTCCPELVKNNEIEIFHSFMCPVSIIEADVKEYIIDEYDSVELLVLRLADAGITNSNGISALTGIDRSLVRSILRTEAFTYGHIDPKTKELTEAGRQTLEDNVDIENLFQHALYNAKREIQADSITGTIIRYEAEELKERMAVFSDSITPNILPRNSVTIDDELEREIQERLWQYLKDGYFNEGDTINDIDNLRTRETRYRRSFFVQMKGFQYPFIAIMYYPERNRRAGKVITPIAIATSDAMKIDYSARIHEYLIRDDECFEYLKNQKELFNNTEGIDSDLIDQILPTTSDDENADIMIDRMESENYTDESIEDVELEPSKIQFINQ